MKKKNFLKTLEDYKEIKRQETKIADNIKK